jgi:fused signal recognition particle receptor
MVTGFFSRLKTAVKSTKDQLVGRIENLILGEKQFGAETLDQLEAILLGADIGVKTTEEILERVRQAVSRDALHDFDALAALIKATLLEILTQPPPVEPVRSKQGPARPAPPPPDPPAGLPRVVFVVGVNGVGKTTTIGKLAHRLSQAGRKVVICASDTFRAAAIEQVEIWAGRSGAALIKKSQGADPAAVLHDSLDVAARERADVVIVDTAGRLHTKLNLMKELEKMHRLAAKRVPGAPHDVYLIIDATTGQNGLVQAREFLKTTGVTGLIVTKLDGTAKGGVVVAIARELRLPIHYVGVGEKMEDLIDFSAEDFVESLFAS